MTALFPPELLLLGGLSALFLWIGARSSFFSLPDQRSVWSPPLSWLHVLGAFLCYFFVGALVPFLMHWVRMHLTFSTREELLGLVSWTNFLTSFSILTLLFLGMRRLPRQTARAILLRPGPHSWALDGKLALKAWVFSFPLVLFVNALFEFVLTSLLHVEKLPEQLAVAFIKATFSHPLHLFLGSLTIILLAPLIEETLFRGFLQSYLRKYLGSKHALVLTALCFSFFHYSPEQKIANLPIIASLFALSLFLGLVYEKSGSLFSSILLHSGFNTFNLFNLYFLSDFPKGPL